MVDIVNSSKALSVNPLKVSQRVGAVLAFLGLSRSLPLEHGVRGCAAFAKLFFMRHFREPIPLQTTAMDQTCTILGADENVIEALQTLIERNHPEIVGIVASTLSEFQGIDLPRTLAEFRRRFPEHDGVAIVPVSVFGDFDSLELGFAHAIEALVETLVPTTFHEVTCSLQVNILASAMLTPGDVNALKEWVEAFGLRPVVVPDLGDALDGHLVDQGFLPLTYGGVARVEIEQLGQAMATLVIGTSMERAANLLTAKTAVPNYCFSSLMGVQACDDLTHTLHTLSGRPVPERLVRQRAQLLDAMVDCQFYTAGTSAALAGDPDLVGMLLRFLNDVGVTVPTVVTTTRVASLQNLPAGRIVIGDLDDLEHEASESSVQLLLANSHAVSIANRLGVPLLRVGYPQHDLIGCHTKTWIGYAGTRQSLFDVANLLMQARGDKQPYTSIYRQTDDGAAASAGAARRSGKERTAA